MNKELLYKILRIESHSRHCDDMIAFLSKHASEKGYEYFLDAPTGNLYMVKGKSKSYPCMVAHVDTVHKIHGHGITVLESGDRVTGFDSTDMLQTGIGGDDKCGIYAALHCMEALDYCKAAFFVDEEIGCNGSRACYMKFFNDCRFVLQADRRGNEDFVNDISGPLASKAFAKAVLPIITSFGYKPHSGAMSDVMALRDNDIGISVANMSAGYYRPHSDTEYIDLEDLERVSLMMEAIARSLVRPYPFTYTKPVQKWGVIHYQGKTYGGTGFSPQHGKGSFRSRFPSWSPGKSWQDGVGWVDQDEKEAQSSLERELAGSGFMTAAEIAKMVKEDREYEEAMLQREYDRSIMGAD